MEQHNPSDLVQGAGHGKDLLLAQFKNGPHIKAVLESMLEEAQLVEDAVGQARAAKNIFTATGWWLDVIGRWLDEPRTTAADNEDETYREKLINKAIKLLQSGEIPAVISAVKAMTLETDVKLLEYYPAHLDVVIFTDNDLDPKVIERMTDIKGGGNGFGLIQAEAKKDNPLISPNLLFIFGETLLNEAVPTPEPVGPLILGSSFDAATLSKNLN